MRNIIKNNKRKQILLFKHEKNNQPLSNDWPTYCHTGVGSSILSIDRTSDSCDFFHKNNTLTTQIQQRNIFFSSRWQRNLLFQLQCKIEFFFRSARALKYLFKKNPSPSPPDKKMVVALIDFTYIQNISVKRIRYGFSTSFYYKNYLPVSYLSIIISKAHLNPTKPS
jgi:hypothetical protein